MFIQEYEKHRKELESRSFTPPSVMSSVTKSLIEGDRGPLRVYTDIPQVEEFLNRPEFILSMYWIQTAFKTCPHHSSLLSFSLTCVVVTIIV